MPTEEKQLTAINSLIEKLTKKKNDALATAKYLANNDKNSQLHDGMFAAYTDAINEAVLLLATERQQLIWAIQEAYGHGRDEANEPHTFEQIQESVELILSKFKTQ